MLKIGVLAVAALMLAAADGQAASVQPGAGYYNTIAYYKSVTPKGGASCPAEGSSAAYSFFYPGPDKIGANAHASGLAVGNYVVGRIIFSKTPAAGAAVWKGGTASESSLGGSSKAAFTAALTYFDSSSFLASANWTEEPASGGSCVEVIEFSFVKI